MLQVLLKRLAVFALAVGALGNCYSRTLASDLRDGAPVESYLAVWGTKNPERDFMKTHYAAVWAEIEKSRIFEKALQIAQSHMSEGDSAQFLAVRTSLQNALAPVQWDKLQDVSEVMYAQKIEGPTSVHLALIRIPDGGAESLRQGIENLFTLASTASQGKLPIASETIAGVELKYLQLPAEMPMRFQPAIGVRDDIFVFTTSLDFARSGLESLDNPSKGSRFSDPRIVEALTHLPAAEDSIVVFDGKQFNSQLKEIPQFITRMSNGDKEAARLTALMSELISQADAFDYEVSVEYTEGLQQRTASYGRLLDNAGETVIGQMMLNQEPFADWKSLVPASASGFSLNSGCTLLPLYDWAMKEIPARFPESQQGLDKLAALQNEHDIHLREDILQAFTGGMVSVSMPGPATPFGNRSDSVMMFRCVQSDRMEELIHRGFNALSEIPQVRQQGIVLEDVDGMEGFMHIKASALAMAQINPVFGFNDGWMVLGSKAESVESLLATMKGEGTSWIESERFKEFGLTADGPVSSISYTNTGENTRSMSQAMQQIGMMAPVFLGMFQAQAQGEGAEAMQIVQEAAGLLPSVGRIVGKLDFFDATMSVTQPGPEKNTYVRNSVTLIRPPAAAEVSESTGSEKPQAVNKP